MKSQVAMIVSGFPRRSETFMLGELLALEASGALAAVFATKIGETGIAQPGTERLTKYVEFLPDAPVEEQARAVRHSLSKLKKVVTGVHGYFAHRPGEVAQHAAQMLGVPFGFSIHARDFRKVAQSDSRCPPGTSRATRFRLCPPGLRDSYRRSSRNCRSTAGREGRR